MVSESFDLPLFSSYLELSFMSLERTLSIVKPDAVRKNVIGQILSRFEAAGLKVVACKMLRLTRDQAEAFYAVHGGKTFFPELIEYMISGPVIVQVLEGKSAIQRNRQVMGATDPQNAESGSIRADFGESVQANAVHGSDGLETARNEIDFFFGDNEINSSL